MTKEQEAQAIQTLVKQHEDLLAGLREDQGFERAACWLFLFIFKQCSLKHKRGKLRDHVLQEFSICDRLRLQFRDDEQTDDAYLQASKQEAYRLVWVAVGFNPDHLQKKKFAPMFYPVDPGPKNTGLMGKTYTYT